MNITIFALALTPPHHPLMKLSALFSLSMAIFVSYASAQTAINNTEESSTVSLPENVFAENTISPVETQVVEEEAQPAAKSAVYFNESFTSETSQEAILGHVTKALVKNPDDACEIVKQAIVVSDADEKLVVRIVEAACMAAPEKMRLIAQCAMAASPDSLQGIQQVMAKLDPGAGDTCISGKECSGKEITGKETIDEKGGVVNPAPAPVYDPLRRAYVPPTPPTIIVPPATNNDRR